LLQFSVSGLVFSRLFHQGYDMRYVVTARVKPGKEAGLLRAIEEGTLGAGSVAEGEYLRNMRDARLYDDGRIKWVEVCFCDYPLAEERPYWESFFELVRVQDAHRRQRCRDVNGLEPWACGECDCTERLESRLAGQGCTFLEVLRAAVAEAA
jgi:hypothetical protein